ncbi:dihydropteroate synthase family protein [Enterococcus faecalis]|nr:dihydropteroate synthase family protein [Enterococcus faecalis]
MIDLKKNYQIMGIVNTTPDSFSDGGSYTTVDVAYQHALHLLEAGADILDIGGQSTRPGYEEVSPQVEADRVLPLIKKIRETSLAPISVDTYYPEVQVVIMHSRKRQSLSLKEELHQFYTEKIEQCQKYGLSLEKICFDPGIGFHKTVAENLQLLKDPNAFRYQDYPLLYGVSRKRTIGALTNEPEPANRDFGSAAASLYAAQQGVEILRVHNVQGLKQTFDVWRALSEKE